MAQSNSGPLNLNKPTNTRRKRARLTPPLSELQNTPVVPTEAPGEIAKLPDLQSSLNKFTGINESGDLKETPSPTEELALQTIPDNTRKELKKGNLFDSQESGSIGCGRHALNNLFGNKYFVKDASGSITDLKQIIGPPVALQNICKFLSTKEPFDKKGENFCPANENYDINVLAVALGVLGYSATSPDRKWITEKNTDDKDLIGYIVNFGESHWVAFRKMQGGKYKLIDSLENSNEISKDLDDLKKENKDRIIDVLQVKFEGKYVDALKTLLTPATTACKFKRGEEVIYTKDDKPIKCVVDGFNWDDNQKCDALVLLPLDPPGNEILVKDLDNVKSIETNSELSSSLVATPNTSLTTVTSSVETPNEKLNLIANETPNLIANQTPNVIANQTPNVTPNVIPNQTPNVIANQTPNVTPNVIPNQTPNTATNTTPNVIPNQTPNTATNTTPNVIANTTVKTPDNIPVTESVDTSIKPELISRTNKYVRFGFGSESGGVASYFNLSEDNTIFSGSPGINGAESGKIADFNNRFTDSQEVKDCMLKYWKPSNTLVKKTISEPFEKQFRAPCNEKDIQILRGAFTRYKQFMEDKIKMDGKSDAEVADKNQHDRILMYLKKLNEGPNQVDCITPNELVDKEKESITIQSLYYSVLPKLFYLMHKKAKENKGPLNIKPIFDEFENLSNDTSFYLQELRKSGIFRNGDYDGVHGMASSVVELFNLLKLMFPGIYSNGISPSLPEMPDINIKEYLGPLLVFLKDSDLSRLIIEDIQMAHNHYKQRDAKNAIEYIGKAFSKLQAHIDKIRQEILTASQPCLNILKLLADTTNANTADEFKEKMLPLMDSPDYMNLAEVDKLNVIMITSKIESLFNQATASASVECPAPPPATRVECPPANSLQPSRESCKPFIDEAKNELYSKILSHIELAFKKLIPSTNNISKMFDPNTPNPSLEKSLNTDLDKALVSDDIDKQAGILQIDTIINTLEIYLQALNNNYDKWKGIFSKEIIPYSPALSRPNSQSLIPASRLALTDSPNSQSLVPDNTLALTDTPNSQSLVPANRLALTDTPNSQSLVPASRLALTDSPNSQSLVPDSSSRLTDYPYNHPYSGHPFTIPPTINDNSDTPDATPTLALTDTPDIQSSVGAPSSRFTDYPYNHPYSGHPFTIPPTINDNSNTPAPALTDYPYNHPYSGDAFMIPPTISDISDSPAPPPPRSDTLVTAIAASTPSASPPMIEAPQRTLGHVIADTISRATSAPPPAPTRPPPLPLPPSPTRSPPLPPSLPPPQPTREQSPLVPPQRVAPVPPQPPSIVPIPAPAPARTPAFSTPYTPDPLLPSPEIPLPAPWKGLSPALFSFLAPPPPSLPPQSIRAQAPLVSPQQVTPALSAEPYISQDQGLKRISDKKSDTTPKIPGYMTSTVSQNRRLASQGYGKLPAGMKKSKYSGGGDDISFGPDEIVPLIAEQVAWEDMNDRYNSLEPEYKNLLPEPEPAPIYSITEPIHRYIDENADKDILEEAHNVIDQMNSDEVDDIFTSNDGNINKLNSIYKKAMPEVNDKWIPNMVRADVLRNVAKKN
jgi:hypothetical protein